MLNVKVERRVVRFVNDVDDERENVMKRGSEVEKKRKEMR